MKGVDPQGDKSRRTPQWKSSCLVLAVLVLLAVSTRLLPLSFSPLPFNNDGITESRIASDIIASGHLSFPSDSFYIDTHSVITPVYDVLLSFVALSLGSTPYDVAQYVIACFSVVIVLGAYLISLVVAGSRKSAILAGIFLSLFGTFAFMTSSTWKESLAIVLTVLLMYAYMNRSDRRMIVLEVAILLILPVTHHLVTVFAYLAIGYLTLWSVFFAARKGLLSRRHFVDIVIVAIPSGGALLYYQLESLSRLSYVDTSLEVAYFGISVLLMVSVSILILRERKYSPLSFSPLPAIAVIVVTVVDYFHPIFPYVQGTPVFTIILAMASSVIVCVSWYGLERIIETRSAYRAIPLGFLLPVITLFCFALLSGLSLKSHQILYRTFDFADLSIGLCLAFGITGFVARPRKQALVIGAVLACLVVTMPFGYYTGELTGVRHDTQEYEVDAILWANQVIGTEASFQSDERLSYVSQSLCDFVKKPDLAYSMANALPISNGTFNLFEEEWTTVGVNAYPRGYALVNPDYAQELLAASNVLYFGGPCSNNVIIFSPIEL